MIFTDERNLELNTHHRISVEDLRNSTIYTKGIFVRFNGVEVLMINASVEEDNQPAIGYSSGFMPLYNGMVYFFQREYKVNENYKEYPKFILEYFWLLRNEIRKYLELVKPFMLSV